jgi:type II secretory pathway pseudopilin PulG
MTASTIKAIKCRPYQPGFSLLELIIYTALLSVIMTAVWMGMADYQKQNAKMETLQSLTNSVNFSIRSSYLIRESDSVSINSDGDCLDLMVDDVSQALWAATDEGDADGRYAFFRATDTTCNALPDSADSYRLTDYIFNLRDSDAGVFIVDNAINNYVQFNVNASATDYNDSTVTQLLNQGHPTTIDIASNNDAIDGDADNGCPVDHDSSKVFFDDITGNYRYAYLVIHGFTGGGTVSLEDGEMVSDVSGASCTFSSANGYLACTSNGLSGINSQAWDTKFDSIYFRPTSTASVNITAYLSSEVLLADSHALIPSPLGTQIITGTKTDEGYLCSYDDYGS